MCGNRQYMALVTVGVILFFAEIFSVSVFASTGSKTLDRNADPVILSGAELPQFLGKPLDQLFVFSYVGGQWQQIPWQFDEIVGGEYIAVDNQQLDAADRVDA